MSKVVAAKRSRMAVITCNLQNQGSRVALGAPPREGKLRLDTVSQHQASKKDDN